MTHTIGTREASLAAPARRAADWLCLAAAPSFAVMALLSGVLGGGAPDMLCTAAPGASPLSGMPAMYLLMSAFHSAPWLKLIASRRAVERLPAKRKRPSLRAERSNPAANDVPPALDCFVGNASSQ